MNVAESALLSELTVATDGQVSYSSPSKVYLVCV
ncbi:hypothetical protein [Pseudomonas sp. 28 E 9]|nr:hypothetical protein [Pseudomonas sp. 28 E 9]